MAPLSGRFVPKHAKIDTSTSGNNTIVAAVAGKRFAVLGYVLFNSAATANSVKFRDGASTDLMGAANLAASGGISVAGNEQAPAFQTSDGNALVLNLSAATAVAGHVTYIEVD